LNKIPEIKAEGDTDFNQAIECGVRSLRQTSDDLNPVLILLTDGQGQNLDKACENLRKYSEVQRNLITICVGLGNEFERKTLEELADSGNLKSRWYELTQLFKRAGAPRLQGDYFLKVGSENLSLVIECVEPQTLSEHFKRIAFALSGVGNSVSGKIEDNLKRIKELNAEQDLAQNKRDEAIRQK